MGSRAHVLNCSMECGIFLDQGFEPMSPAWAGSFFTTEPPGKPCIKYVTGKNKQTNKKPWLFSSCPFSILCSGSLCMEAGSSKGHPVGRGTYVGLLHWRNQSGRSFPISLSIRTQTIPSACYNMVIAPSQLGRGVPQELDWGIIGGSVMSYSSALGPHKCPLLLKLFI